jgi:uncharacterized protein YggU (UPF0235/DUF167 family)
MQLSDGREVLGVRVRVAPEDGAANAALIVLVARSFGVAKSAVTVTAGATSRVKQVSIAGPSDRLAAVAVSLNRDG